MDKTGQLLVAYLPSQVDVIAGLYGQAFHIFVAGLDNLYAIKIKE